MPLWLIFHPEGTFTTTASKQALSESITTIYTGVGLPPFYVVVQFIERPAGTVFVGGVVKDTSSKPFIRIAIEHIAVNLPNEDAQYARVTKKIDEVLKPHIEDAGYDWEYHVDETDRRQWKVNGIAPPPWKSEEEKVWFEENKPSAWEEAN